MSKPVMTHEDVMKLEDDSAIFYKPLSVAPPKFISWGFAGEFDTVDTTRGRHYVHKASGKTVTVRWHKWLEKCASSWSSYDGFAVNRSAREHYWMMTGVFAITFENSDRLDALKALITEELNLMYPNKRTVSEKHQDFGWDDPDGNTMAEFWAAYNGQGDKLMIRVMHDDGTLHPFAIWWEQTFGREDDGHSLPGELEDRIDDIEYALNNEHEFGAFVEYHIDSDWKMWMKGDDESEERMSMYRAALELLRQHDWADYVSSEQFLCIGFPRSHTQTDQDFVMGLALGFAGCFSEELDQEINGQATSQETGDDAPYSEWYVRFLYLCSHIRKDRPGIYGQIGRNGYRMHKQAQKYIPTQINRELNKVWNAMTPMSADDYAALISLGAYVGHDGHDPDQDMTAKGKRGYNALVKRLAALPLSKRAKLIDLFHKRAHEKKVNLQPDVAGWEMTLAKLMEQWYSATEMFHYWNRTVDNRLEMMEDIQARINRGETVRAFKMEYPNWHAVWEECTFKGYCQFLLDTDKFYTGGIFDEHTQREFCTPE